MSLPRIVIVEDNPADLLLIRKAIDRVHIEAELHSVLDGQAAAQFFDAVDTDENAQVPSLVLLDLNLPKKNGEEVLRHLRASSKCGRVPVLIVTSSDLKRELQPLQELGVAGYFRKPSQFAEFMKLGTVVQSLLKDPTPGPGH